MPQRQRRKHTGKRLHRQHENTALVKSIKNETPCTDCSKPYPWYVMEFDHVPGRGRKRDNVTTMAWDGVEEQLLLDEIAKCDVVCANCHREREFQRRATRLGA